jgi:hypothetical protein
MARTTPALEAAEAVMLLEDLQQVPTRSTPCRTHTVPRTRPAKPVLKQGGGQTRKPRIAVNGGLQRRLLGSIE